MPDRNLVHDVLVLRARESPGGGRFVVLMSAQAGIIDAFVFGGPKSRLRSLASPYAAGRAYLYHDPVRDFLKLSDFEVGESLSGLREGLRRLMGAGLVAEFLQKSSGGGGDFPEVLELALDTLRALEVSDEERSDYPLVLFLWRMTGMLGLGPDLGACVHCGAPLGRAGAIPWSWADSGLLCPRCAGHATGEGEASASPGVLLGPEALRWLDRSAGLPFAEAVLEELDPASLSGLKALAFGLARRAVDGPLATLRAGAGIL